MIQNKHTNNRPSQNRGHSMHRHSRIRTLRKSPPPSGKNAGTAKRRTTHIPKPQRAINASSKTPTKKPERRRPDSRRPAPKKTKTEIKIPLPGDNLRIVTIGGVEQIGRNMTVIEYKEDMVVIDAGFEFPEVETPGIDYIIPSVDYLEERKEKIRGLFITHGHYDHIGAIPHIMHKIGNPPLYTREFGALVIKKRQTDYPTAPPLDIRVVEGRERVKAGKHISVRFFPLSHAIRDAMGMIIETPVGNVVIVTDVRVNHVNDIPTKEEEENYGFLKNEKVLLFMLDSTDIEYPGFSPPEADAVAGVGKIIKGTKGRLLIGTFSSQVERIMEFIKIADACGKKVIIDGRSMKGNVEILKQLGLIKTKNIIPIDQMKDYPPEKIVIIATGAQGEKYSTLDRLANGTHRFIKLTEADSLVLSASIIPGNDMDVQKLKDRLYRTKAKIITYREDNVHSSGHGNRGELEWIHKQIPYRFFMPMHGHHYMLHLHAESAKKLGAPASNVIIPENNGAIIEISPDGKKITQLKEQAPAYAVMVDGFSVSGQHEVVIRDRQHLSEDGIVVVVVTVDPRTGKVRKSPDIIARGFVYVRESQQLFNEARAIIKRTVEKTTKGMNPINFDYTRNTVTDEIRRHLFQKTGKSPMVIPVIISV